MNKNIFTFIFSLLLLMAGVNSRAEKVVVDINGGDVNIMGTLMNVPDYTKWYYFSFETGSVVGTSDFTLTNVEGTIGDETPNAEWAARTDWDIAFHATDIRTNGAKAVLVADTTSATALEEVYANLAEAPESGYNADELTTGVFIASMSSMPPLRATRMSVCKAAHGWAVFGMSSGPGNPKVLVVERPNGEYVKVFLKSFFNAEGNPGYIEMEYDSFRNEEKGVIDVNGGDINIMGIIMNVPDYTKWYYYSFKTGSVVGTSDFTLTNVEGTIGDEAPDAGWAARTDWDIAFHATDIRTNGAKAILIADTTSATPLAEVYANLLSAPGSGYEADETVKGVFMASMASMPPMRATQMSVCKATNGWATFGMSASAANPSVVVFELANNEYVKVFLKEFFNEDGKPGYIRMDYEVIPLDEADGVNEVRKINLTMYPNPATDVLNVELEEDATVTLIGMTGVVMKQIPAKAGVNPIVVSDLPSGTYLIKVNNRVEKIIVQ